MMWKPVVGRNVYAQGGYVQDLIKQNPGMEKDSTVKMALSDEQEREKFFAPDPNMYRDPAKNMKNVQEYIQDQGVELVGKRQKPTAADLLGKFQEGQSAGEAMEQSAAPTAPTPAAPAAPPQRSGGLGMNLDNSMELSALSAPSSGLSGASPAGISTGLGLDPSRPGMFRKGGAVMDYRQGGPVAGGPPGVDTVPAMLNNGEYVLPRPTTQAMGGKPALDQAVLATTGKPPVGYGQGGMPVRSTYDQLRMRGQDVGNAIDRMTVTPLAAQGFSGSQQSALARVRPAPVAPPGAPVLSGGMPGT